MEEWKEFVLEDLLSSPIRNGLTKPTSIRGKGVKMIGMGELFAHDIIYDIDMPRVPVSENELNNCRIEDKDLLFARQSLKLEGAGKCSIVINPGKNTVFESHLIRVRIDNHKASPLFLYYYFLSSIGKNKIQTLVQQVAAAGIRGSELIKLVLYLPCDVNKQKRIASILKSLDDKIENNRKINDNLEHQAQALFKSWFVDFEPFRDQPFVESELGMIPEGWRVFSFSELLTPSTQKVGKDGVPEYSVTNTGIHPRDEKFTKKLSASSANNKMLYMVIQKCTT